MVENTFSERLYQYRKRHRKKFHWRLSSVVLPFLVGTGIALATVQITVSNLCFAGFGIWGILHWLTSDRVMAIRRKLRAVRVRANRVVFKEVTRKCFFMEWGVSIVYVLFTIACLVGAARYRRGYEQEETFKDLTATVALIPGGESKPMSSKFTVHNGGYVGLAKHRLVCYVVSAVGNDGLSEWVDPSMMKDGESLIGNDVLAELRKEQSEPSHQPIVEPGGDAWTDQCINYFNFAANTECVDVIAVIYYSLETQPDTGKVKRFRFVAEKGLGARFDWSQQLDRGTSSYCDRFLNPLWHQQMIPLGKEPDK